MLEKKYLIKIKKEVVEFSKNKDWKIFIFGSSLEREKFGDIDLGVEGDITDSEIRELKEIFRESTLPFKVDVVNIKKTKKSFRDNVLNNKILWIKR